MPLPTRRYDVPALVRGIELAGSLLIFQCAQMDDRKWSMKEPEVSGSIGQARSPFVLCPCDANSIRHWPSLQSHGSSTQTTTFSSIVSYLVPSASEMLSISQAWKACSARYRPKCDHLRHIHSVPRKSQVTYPLQLLEPLRAGVLNSVALTDVATDRYNDMLQERLEDSVWSQWPSWYRTGSRGRIFSTFPGPLVELWW